MILLKQPDQSRLKNYLERQASESFSYPEVGATRLGERPQGYNFNHSRRLLGQGKATFQLACNSLQARQPLQLGWVSSWPPSAPLKSGQDVVILGRALGLWWMNGCRLAYVVDERDSAGRFGYAHGTLPDHLARGEERFLVEILEDESVWLDIFAFSRPQSWLATLGYPYLRHSQRRFGLEAVAAVQEFVDEHSLGPEPVAHTESVGRNAAYRSTGLAGHSESGRS